MAAPDKEKRELSIAFIKPGDTKFSRFFCQQFMYDYLTGDLDPKRKEFLLEQLSADEDLKKELASLKRASEYCSNLGGLSVHREMMDRFLSHQSVWETATAKLRFKAWPDFLKWGVEALGLGVFIAFLMLVIPWDKIENKIVTTKRHEFFLGSRTNLAPSESDVEDHKEEVVEETKEESKPNIVATAPVAPVAVTKDEEIKPTIPVVAVSPVVEKIESQAPQAETQLEPSLDVKPLPPIVSTPVAEKPTQVSARVEIGTTQPTRALKGELFRLFMRVSNVDDVSNTIKSEIERLGGDKAGEVPLGWRKDGSSYFHFTIPADQHQTLINQIKLLGPLSEQKEGHWRVMPDGTHRMILNVMPKETP